MSVSPEMFENIANEMRPTQRMAGRSPASKGMLRSPDRAHEGVAASLRILTERHSSDDFFLRGFDHSPNPAVVESRNRPVKEVRVDAHLVEQICFMLVIDTHVHDVGVHLPSDERLGLFSQIFDFCDRSAGARTEPDLLLLHGGQDLTLGITNRTVVERDFAALVGHVAQRLVRRVELRGLGHGGSLLVGFIFFIDEVDECHHADETADDRDGAEDVPAAAHQGLLSLGSKNGRIHVVLIQTAACR